MPPDAPTNLEQLLRRYAKERREQAGDVSVHPATRRLLHGEVARVLGAKSNAAPAAEARHPWFSAWRGAMLGSAFVVLLGAVIFALVWERENPRMARLEDAPELTAPAAISGRMEDESATADAKKAADAPVASEPATARAALALKPAAPSLPTGPAPSAPAATPPPPALDVVAEKSLRENESVTSTAHSPAPVARERLATKGGALAPTGQTTELGNAQAIQQQMKSTDAGAVSDSADIARARLMKQQAEPTTQTSAGLAGVAQNMPSGSQAVLNSQASAMNNNAQFSNQAEGTQRTMIAGNTSEAVRVAARAQGLGEQNEAAAAKEAFTAGAALANNSVADNRTAEQRAEQMLRPNAPSPDAFNYTANAGQQAAPTPAPEPQARGFGRSVATGTIADATRDSATSPLAPTATDAAKLKAAQASSAPAELSVLSRFNINQAGTTIRLTDADGSVYEGAVVDDTATNSALFSRTTGNYREAKQLADAADISRLPLRFQAVGTNRTLQQRVEVNGRLPRLTGQATFGLETAVDSVQVKSEKDVALQIVAPRSAVPSTTPIGGVRGQRQVTRTNAPLVEGTIQVGRSAGRRFRAIGIDEQ